MNFTEEGWKKFLSQHKAVNYPEAAASNDVYFKNSKQLLMDDLHQLRTEGPMTLKFYPHDDVAFCHLTLTEKGQLPDLYKWKFEAWKHYAKLQGYTVQIEQIHYGDMPQTYRVTIQPTPQIEKAKLT